MLPGRRRAALRVAGVDERVEVPAHTRSGNSQLIADFGRRDRPGFQQQLHDCATGVALAAVWNEFHNTIVTEFRNPV